MAGRVGGVGWVCWPPGFPLCIGSAVSCVRRAAGPLMKTKSSGWGGNRRFKDHRLRLLYGIVGTTSAGRTSGQAYPALVRAVSPPYDGNKQAWSFLCSWESTTWSPLRFIIT